MISQYFTVYNNFDLVQQNLLYKIQQNFTPQQLQKPMTYQEILIYLDQLCQQFAKINKQIIKQYGQKNPNLHHNILSNSRSRYAAGLQNDSHNLSKDQFRRLYFRADRNISKEIFDNCIKNQDQKVVLRDYIKKYIEMLETAKLCLIREQSKMKIIQHRMIQAKKSVRRKTYIYIKLIQATIHSRYSDNPCFQYKIYPSSIPQITIINSLNPILNHQYTLEMNQNWFQIIFYQSGVEIFKWKFMTKQFSKDGEYYKSVAAQAVTFQVQVKMLPEKTSQEVTELLRQLQLSEQKLQISSKAFQNMCFYMPFLETHKKLNSSVEDQFDGEQKGPFWNFSVSLFEFLPFLRSHVMILHHVLISLIFIECLAAMSWAVEFIDLIIAFGLIGILYDRTKINVRIYLWVGMFSLFLSTIKTVWGALLSPFGMPKYPLILAIAIIFKVLTLFAIWISTIRSDEISLQRIKNIYGVQFAQQQVEVQEQRPIFKANQNYYKNKMINQQQQMNNLIRIN